jgi:type II secretory pathway component GspD/PulD (secretin)
VVIVQDYPENLAIVEEMISKLDIMPEQVLIEAVIIRVDLNRNQQLGVNFGAVDQMHSLLGVIGDSSQFGQTVGFAPLKLLNTNGSVAGVSATGGNTVTGTQFGNSGYGIKFGYIGGNASTFVQALETLGKTNVLATPRVLVLNKQRAEIQLGQRLGYKTLVTNLTSTVQQVQFLNTGTLLRLRPFISDDSMIRMEIHPERSTGLIDANGVPQTNTARMTTNIVIPNGATLVIGGLIDNQDDTTQSGVPVDPPDLERRRSRGPELRPDSQDRPRHRDPRFPEDRTRGRPPVPGRHSRWSALLRHAQSGRPAPGHRPWQEPLHPHGQERREFLDHLQALLPIGPLLYGSLVG